MADGHADAVRADGGAGADRQHRAVAAVRTGRRCARRHRRSTAHHSRHACRADFAARGLGIAEITGIVGPITLLIGTFVIGAGFAIYLPAQQASVNDIVTRAEIPRAVSLGAVAFNVARALGPALAGALAAWLSSGSAFLVAAVFFFVMIVAVYPYPEPGPSRIPGVPETLFSGIQSGLRYARHSKPLRSLVIRNFSFSFCASALWALMPLVARDQLALGAGGYGTLMASFGAGAIVGALAIPQQMSRRSLNSIVTSGVVLWAVAATLMAVTAIAAARDRRRGRRGRGVGHGALESRGRNAKRRARMGAGTRRRDQSRDQPGEPRARQRRVGDRRNAFQHADRARGVGRRDVAVARAQSAHPGRVRRGGRRDAGRAPAGPCDSADACTRGRPRADPDRIPDCARESGGVPARRSTRSKRRGGETVPAAGASIAISSRTAASSSVS